MPKFKKEKKVLRAQAGILTPFSGKSRTPAPESNVDVYPVVPRVYADPMQREGAYGGGGIDEAYKWLTGKSEGLPLGIKSLADINRGLLPGVAAQSDVNKGLAEIADIWRSGKSPSDIGVMRGSSSIDEPAKDTAKSKQEEAAPSKKEAASSKAGLNQAPRQSGQARAKASPSPGVVNQALIDRLVKSAPMKTIAVPEATKFTPTMSEVDQDAMMNAITSAYMGPKKSDISDLTSRSTGASSAAAAIPKTKAGLKKFMQDYGKYIALGAMAGQGGKAGQIAAPIMAALPGLIEMLKNKGKKPASTPAASAGNGVQVGMARGGSVGKKSSGTEAQKKSAGGAIRKFKGGPMKDEMMMKKGKTADAMPQHKKMAMGKPTPQSMGQKFAKGGTAKYAEGGTCKGYGIAKKIRPTGPMN